MQYDVLTFGSITLDIFVTAQEALEKNDVFEIPIGEKILLRDVVQSCGGSSANASVGFQKFGLRTGTFGFLGHDRIGESIQNILEKEDINTQFLEITEESASSLSIILNTQSGHRSVLNYKNPMEDFDPRHLFEAPKTRSLYVGHLTDKSDDFLLALPEWKSQNPHALIGWNPGKTQFKKGIDHFTSVFPSIDVLILNKEEAEYFTNMKAPKLDFKSATSKEIGTKLLINPPFIDTTVFDMRGIAEVFLSLGVKTLVITDSKRGAQLFDTNGNHFFVPAPDVPIVSTLGAGDAFSVGILTALLLKEPIKNVLLWGAWSSGHVIQKFGAQCGQATQDDVRALL